MAAVNGTTIATRIEPDGDRETEPEQRRGAVASPGDRHDLRRIETGEYQELVQCRACGRSGAPNEISVYEYCAGTRDGTVGMRLDSMVGISGGRSR